MNEIGTVPSEVLCLPVTGIGEVRQGDDLAQIIVDTAPLHGGDVVVITSKVVSKAEGRTVRDDKATAIARETDRVLATRGATQIVRTHHGLVMAGAGVDTSNTEPGTVVLLPVDPDASARTLREGVAALGGPNVAVVVTDTAGRAWRNGQTDIAIGAAGLDVLHHYNGRTDGYGNELAVTAPAIADELAAVGDLVKGKLAGLPVAVVRGLGHLVLPPDEHGPGAQALVRDEATDMFGLGAREAVRHAVHAGERRGFGASVPAEELAAALTELLPHGSVISTHVDLVEVEVRGEGSEPASQRALGALLGRAVTLGFALGWAGQENPPTRDTDVRLRFSPLTP